MAVKVRLPKIAALEMIDGIAAKAEWDCGCVTVKLTSPDHPAVWTYLERCDAHAKKHMARFGGRILMDPSMLVDREIRKDWRP